MVYSFEQVDMDGADSAPVSVTNYFRAGQASSGRPNPARAEVQARK
jgi:hypothetical protein